MAIFRRRKQEDAETSFASDSSASNISESAVCGSSVSENSTSALAAVRGFEKLSEDVWEGIEKHLLSADLGVATARRLLESVKAEATSPAEAAELLRQALIDDLSGNFRGNSRGNPAGDEPLGEADGAESASAGIEERRAFDTTLSTEGSPAVWLVVGVNGVGKTTTIAKLAKRENDMGRRVVLAAADTFRAAATQQLQMWAERVGVSVVHGSEGSDPGSVVFDAVEHAAANKADIVIADTAGRIHTKSNLMDEISKVRRVADKASGRVSEVLLVLDATNGQNGIAQAKVFTEAVDVTGIVLTKLDGAGKGGIVVSVQHDLGLPVKLIGVGEQIDDLEVFDPEQFADALLGEVSS